MPRLLVAVVVAACACSAPKGLDTFPSRDIDRPYTLPADVNTWFMPVVSAYQPAHDDEESEFLPPIPLPFFYSISLTENLTMDAALIPSSLRYQVHRGDTHLVGISAGVGLPAYSSVDGGLIVPIQAGAFHRIRLARSIALESTVGGSFVVRTDGDEGWGTSLSTGPLFQLTDRVSFRPSAAFGLGKANGLFSSDDDDIDPDLSVSADVGWNLHRRWRLSAGYGLTGIIDDGVTHIGVLSVVLYW